MVVADQALATEVGVSVLRDGGNAVDAAVATAFALAVALPSAGNIGGGGFMVAHIDGQAYALDFRETAPAAGSRDMYLDADGETGDRSVTGHLAAGVPGSVAGIVGGPREARLEAVGRTGAAGHSPRRGGVRGR